MGYNLATYTLRPVLLASIKLCQDSAAAPPAARIC